MLTWAVRTLAIEHFDIRVKEDLLRHERAQKRSMWFIIDALYAAYFYPTWNRANVVWKWQGRWFEVLPGEIPTHFTATQIEEYCNQKCGYPTAHSSQHTEKHFDQQLLVPHQEVKADVQEMATQTQYTGESKFQLLQNAVVSLQQDVSAEKMKKVQKSVECCELRRKLKAKDSSVSAFTQTEKSDTVVYHNSATQTKLVFDSNGLTDDSDSVVVQVEAAGVYIEVPAGLKTAARALDAHYQCELGKREAEILALRESLKATVDFDIQGDTIAIPKAFEDYAIQMDVMFTKVVRAAVAEVGAGEGWFQLGEAKEIQLGDFACKTYLGLEQYLTPSLLAMQQSRHETESRLRLGMQALQTTLVQVQEKVERMAGDITAYKAEKARLLQENANYQQMQGKLKIAQNLITSLKLENLELTNQKPSTCV